jgi:hypothetical protein
MSWATPRELGAGAGADVGCATEASVALDAAGIATSEGAGGGSSSWLELLSESVMSICSPTPMVRLVTWSPLRLRRGALGGVPPLSADGAV